MQVSTVGFLLATDFAQGIIKSVASFATGTGQFIASLFASSTALKAQAAASAGATVADAAEAGGSAAATVADAAEASTSLFAALANGVLALASAAAASPLIALGAFAAVLATVIAVMYLYSDAVAQAAEAAKERAIEKGDVDEAVKQAETQAEGERGKAAATGAGVGALTGAAIGAIFGPIGIAVGAAIGGILGFFAGDFFLPFDKTKEVLTKTAAAAALQAKAHDELAESGKAATQAMKDFQAGNISAAEALAANASGTAAVIAAQRANIAANTALMKNTRTAASAVGDFLVGLTGFSFGFGTTKQNEDKAQAQIDENNKEQKKLESEALAQSQPAINALGKQVAATGGDFNTFMAQLRAANPALADLADQDDLKKAFDNIAKEAERTRAAFDAMNLGFQGINAAAAAANLGMSNLVDGFDGSISRMDQTINTLKAGVTNAAQGMEAGVFEEAVDHASAQIERLGGDATKFRENIMAINQAQKFFVSASNQAKEALMADFKRGAGGAGNAGDRRGAFADAVVGQMDGVGQDVKDRIMDALKGADISNEDLDEIMAGNMDVLDKVLKDLGDTTLDQVLPALENLAEASEKLAQVQRKRLALEDELASAVKRQIDVTLEAAEIMAEFGGAQVTPEQRSQAIVDKLNVTGADLNLPQMTSGTADEIRARNRAIATQQEEQREVRNRAAAGDKEAQERINSPEFQAQEERLQKASEENYQLTKALIDVKREEIKVINAKNAAEKKAAEQLLGNDIEGFLDTMAGKGAAAAAAIGDPTLANQFGISAFGTANKQLEEMQQAGVTSFMGRDIGQVRQNAVGFGLSNAGLAPGVAQGMAEAATGTSPEAEAAKAAARDLASTLPQSTGNLKTATANMLEAARIQEREANKQVQKAVDEVERNTPTTTTTPPPTEKFDPTTGKPIVNPFTDPVGAAMQEQGLDPTVSSPASGATTPPAQEKEQLASTLQQEFDRVKSQVEGDVQKVFVVNFGEMAGLSDASFAQTASVQAVEGGGGGFLGGLTSAITAPLRAVSNIGSSVSSAISAPFNALAGAINPLSQNTLSLNTSIQTLAGALGGGLDLSGLDGFGDNLTVFNESFKAQVDRLEAMSINITFGAPVDVNVNINGAEALKSITAEAKKEIMAEVSNKLNNLYAGNERIQQREAPLG